MTFSTEKVGVIKTPQVYLGKGDIPNPIVTRDRQIKRQQTNRTSKVKPTKMSTSIIWQTCVLKLLMYEKMVLATHTIRAPALNC